MHGRPLSSFVAGALLLLLLAAPAAAGAGAALEIVGPRGQRTLTLAALRKLRATEGAAGAKSSSGKIVAPRIYRGVALRDLLAEAGLDSTQSVSVQARDGYAITLTSAQALAGDFTAYDASTGLPLATRVPLTAVLAYACDGAPLDAEKEGALRLVIVCPRRDAVTDGHWWVKWVTKLALGPASQPWTLDLAGAREERLDRSTFESCASPGCHGARWRDEEGREWSGVPLWLLVGRVDDGVPHGARAFADSLAGRGYAVDVIARDGRGAVIASRRLARSPDFLVAHRLGEQPLGDADGPLRLVGAGLAPGESVAGVGKIVVRREGEGETRAGGSR